MHSRSLLSENSGLFSIQDSNTECIQLEFEFYNRSSKIRTLFNIPSSIVADICDWILFFEIKHIGNKSYAWNFR